MQVPAPPASCILYPAPRNPILGATVDNSSDPPPKSPAFLCDAMLGSLARWLRFFGLDAAYLEPGAPDRVLAELAETEGRWLVTRDRELASVGPRTLLVRSQDLDDQLVEVFSRLAIRPAADLGSSRCGECNGALERVARDEVARSVPRHVRATAEGFRRCTGCGRIYWRGSHSHRIVRRMRLIAARLDG